MKVHLVIIDPQMDFCWPGIDTVKYDVTALRETGLDSLIAPGSLYVPGAHEDMVRLSSMIKKIKHKIDDIHITLDSHHYFDVAHPPMMVDSEGKHPGPFTIITVDDMIKGKYRTTIPGMQQRIAAYVSQLEKNGRYPLCTWPPHCLIGRFGAAMHPAISKAILEWEQQYSVVDFVTKGSNIWTEHYSAVQADVPDPEDPTTLLNEDFIKTLDTADVIAIAGQALSHCLANTVRDTANNFGEESIKKMVLLTDATSNVPGFEHYGDGFIKEMTARGMKVSTTADFLQ